MIAMVDADDRAAGRSRRWVTPVADGRVSAERLITAGVDRTVPPEVADGR